MTNQPSRTSHTALSPLPLGSSEPTSVGVAYYRTDHELTFYLRALQRVRAGRLVVVLGLRKGDRVLPADMPTSVRIILTAQSHDIDLNEGVGWFVRDPLKAVVLAITGLQPKDGLILLFPTDWQGDSPESLIDKARCQRAGLMELHIEPQSE